MTCTGCNRVLLMPSALGGLVIALTHLLLPAAAR